MLLLVQRLSADHPGRSLSYFRKQEIPHWLVQNNDSNYPFGDSADGLYLVLPQEQSLIDRRPQ